MPVQPPDSNTNANSKTGRDPDANSGSNADPDTNSNADPDTKLGDRATPERRLAHLTAWFRRRPTSLEFWEVVVTTERVVWCFVGESFSSLLLRADVGETGRRELEGRAADELLALNERNFATPLADLRRVELDGGSRLRRASLTLAWREGDEDVSWTLSNTSDGRPQVDAVESLASVDELSHVDVSVTPGGGLF